MNDLPATIELADAVVVTLVCSGTSLLVGLVWGRSEKAATQRQRVAERRANRLRHRAPEPDDEQGPDTTVDEPAEQTARQRFTGLAMTPAATMRGEARVLRQETREIRIISDELFIGAGMRDVFAAVYGEGQVRLPLYEEVVAGYETGQYPMVRTQPDNPITTEPGGAPVPKLIGQPRVPASVLHAIHNRQPVPTTPVPTSGPRPGTNTDTDGRPSQPKPSTVGAAR